MWILMAMPAPLGLGFESQRNINKFQCWEIVFRLLRITCICAVLLFVQAADGLGSMSTIAVSHSGNTTSVCGIVKGGNIWCWDLREPGNFSELSRGDSFEGISGGRGVVCGVREGGLVLLCWNRGRGREWNLKRLSYKTQLKQVAVGETHISGLSEEGQILGWRWRRVPQPSARFAAITAGRDFTCGIGVLNETAQCWGPNVPLNVNDSRPMVSISAGLSHVCGIGTDGQVTCWGSSNDSGKLNVPAHDSYEFDSVVSGANHSCARRKIDGTVVCWGSVRAGGYPQNISFETIVASDVYTCGIVTANLTLLCWGDEASGNSSFVFAPWNDTLPLPCQSTPCNCGDYPLSEYLCGVSPLHMCKSCLFNPPPPPPISPPPPPPPPPPPISPPPVSPRVVTKKNRSTIPVVVVGSVGSLLGLCSGVWWIYFRFFRRSKRCSGRVCDPEQEQEQRQQQEASLHAPSRSIPRRQRSGPSRRRERPEEFYLLDLSLATGGFSEEAKLGSGSFGTVYQGTLQDGRRVAIKRGETRTAKKYQENESAFDSELSFLSRVHHKNLVYLVGYCEEEDERLLVYEYMSHGSLHDHLHKVSRISPPLDSWAMRIKIALDAARGVEYLHTYAVPPIIHRDIKSSNILLDGSWNAKVSDFGLSLMGPRDDDSSSHLSLMAAGTVGYMDPEYYRMQHLTTKSDVYSFGVVLLELLTGKKAIHKYDGSGGPRNVVDYALPHIMEDDLPTVLDDRLPPPRPYEIEAVTFVGFTAKDCVQLEGKDRPSMTEVVASLESALAFCAHAALSASASRSLHNDDDFPVL